jgi:hypothetical protein
MLQAGLASDLSLTSDFMEGSVDGFLQRAPFAVHESLTFCFGESPFRSILPHQRQSVKYLVTTTGVWDEGVGSALFDYGRWMEMERVQSAEPEGVGSRGCQKGSQ